MQRRPDSVDIGFNARVPRSDKLAFEGVLPMKGAKTWWMETALRKFNDACEADPVLQSRVHDAIAQANGEEPPRGLHEFQTRVPLKEYERFNKMFGEKGATTWLVRNLLALYLKRYETQGTVEDEVNESVRELLGLEPKAL